MRRAAYLFSSPGFPGEGDRAAMEGILHAHKKGFPLHHAAHGPPPLQMQGRNMLWEPHP